MYICIYIYVYIYIKYMYIIYLYVSGDNTDQNGGRYAILDA